MTSFSEDMRRRGMTPGSRTLSIERELAGARLGRLAPRLPVRGNPRDQAASARRRRDDGDRDAPPPGARSCPASSRRISPARSTSSSATATAIVIVERHPGDRADGDGRGGVGGARRPAPLAGVPLRAHEPRRGRPHASSTSSRSTAATATGSSPSSAGRRRRNLALDIAPVRCASVPPWPTGTDQSARTTSRGPHGHSGSDGEVARRRLEETLMRPRVFVAAVAAVRSGVVAATASASPQQGAGQQADRVAAGRRAVRLAGRRRRSERSSSRRITPAGRSTSSTRTGATISRSSTRRSPAATRRT